MRITIDVYGPPVPYRKERTPVRVTLFDNPKEGLTSVKDILGRFKAQTFHAFYQIVEVDAMG